MRKLLLIVAMAGAVHAPASAQTPRSDLDLAARRGGLATLAGLCGLRDQGWSEDLRRAAIQDATRAPTPDDPALQAAPGNDLAIGAIGYGDVEATEAFAADAQPAVCGKLAHDPALADADLRVAAFRGDVRRTQRLW